MFKLYPGGLVGFSCGLSLLVRFTNAQSYSATYLPSNAPNQTEQGQTGTNQCGTSVDQASLCQNAYCAMLVNSVDDFCLFAPPDPGPGSVIGNTERVEVAWCLKAGTGGRLIPDGAITGAHFVQTPDYVQITGVGDLTKIDVPAGDAGGELDPHGADGNGNPIGGLVFSNVFGSLMQIHEWTEFIYDGGFCFRACKDGPNAPELCQHIYDELGCGWNIPGNYSAGVFEKCKGDSAEPMGIYGNSTFFQGQPVTPPAHPAPSSSLCTTLSTIGNGYVISGTSVLSSPPSSSPSPLSSTAAASNMSPAASRPVPSAAATTQASAAEHAASVIWHLIALGIIIAAGIPFA